MGQSWTRSWGTDTLESGGKITEHMAAKAANQLTAGEKAAATLFFAEVGERRWVANVFVLNIARIHVDDSITFR